jgi:hypothetical protein
VIIAMPQSGQGGRSKSSMAKSGLIESGHYARFAGIFDSAFLRFRRVVRLEDSLFCPHLLQQLLDSIKRSWSPMLARIRS